MAQGFGGDMGSLLKRAQELRRRVEEVQRDLAERVVEGTAAGGLVKVRVSGSLEIQEIKIDKQAVDPDDVGSLEDLVTVAVRHAVSAACELKDREMEKVTGGMNLPGMGF